MNKTSLKHSGYLALLLTGILLSSSAFAEKPAWAGQGGEKKKHQEKYDRNDSDRHGGGDSNDLNVHVDVYLVMMIEWLFMTTMKSVIAMAIARRA